MPQSTVVKSTSSSRFSNTQTSFYRLVYAKTNPKTFYPDDTVTIRNAGCPHLRLIKGNDEYISMVSTYHRLVRYALLWSKQQQLPKKTRRDKELPVPRCHGCTDNLSRLHMCLHCVFMGCWKNGHMRQHLKSSDHTFAMDFGRCTLYCSKCHDYVYDTEWMECIIQMERLKLNLGNRQFKSRSSLTGTIDNSSDVGLMTHNAKLTPCQGIRGLCNMGNTCFMNVILQSFLHNPLLKAYFLSNQHNPKHCSTKHCLCCEMDRLFEEVYDPRQKEPHGPCHFLQAMWMSFKELAGYAQQDAHEFFISALNGIHASSEGHSTAHCKCIVHQTFAGVLQSTVTCCRCGNITTTDDPMLDISVSMSHVSANESTNATTGKHSGASAHLRKQRYQTLVGCLDRYTQPEKLGIQDYICCNCGTFQEATKQLSIKQLPSVLSFQLKRFEHSASASKIDSKIKFPVDLDMTMYTTDAKSLQNIANQYTLFAVINHQGKMDTGHYTMFAKNRQQWFRFDDHHVTMTFQRDVLESKA
ncbi:hypothetical protein BC940DRAFT_313446 [Gongronella butleri]|nr:hypothetical protein BC940DRAFT_313446 [Gongronella butleri]